MTILLPFYPMTTKGEDDARSVIPLNIASHHVIAFHKMAGIAERHPSNYCAGALCLRYKVVVVTTVVYSSSRPLSNPGTTCIRNRRNGQPQVLLAQQRPTQTMDWIEPGSNPGTTSRHHGGTAARRRGEDTTEDIQKRKRSIQRGGKARSSWAVVV
jgi:hypothetical protein